MPAATDTIATQIRRLAVPIDSLTPHPENPRRGDASAIASSLLRFHQLKPIVALAANGENSLPDGTIIAGHHIWYAAQELGWKKVAAVREPMSDAQAKAFMIADNRLSDLGTYDDEQLAAVLVEIRDGDDLDGTGWDDRQVEDLLKKLQAPEGFSDPEAGANDTEYKCPSCGYAWSGSAS